MVLGEFKMPVRDEYDGPVEVSVACNDCLYVRHVRRGHVTEFTVSRYNAARLLLMFCLFLSVPMPKRLAKLTF